MSDDDTPELLTELAGKLDYKTYLRLEQLLSVQRPLASPPHHDELLFIVQHQTSELSLEFVPLRGAATAAQAARAGQAHPAHTETHRRRRRKVLGDGRPFGKGRAPPG